MLLLGEIQRLRQQVHQLQLERDIPTKANELIKKELGISFLTRRTGRQLGQLVPLRKSILLLSCLEFCKQPAAFISTTKPESACAISMRKIRCNESGEVTTTSWDHNITVQENIRSLETDISIQPLHSMSSESGPCSRQRSSNRRQCLSEISSRLAARRVVRRRSITS